MEEASRKLTHYANSLADYCKQTQETQLDEETQLQAEGPAGGIPDPPPQTDHREDKMGPPERTTWLAQTVLKYQVHKFLKRQRPGPYSTPALDSKQAKDMLEAVDAIGNVVRDACKEAARSAATTAASSGQVARSPRQ